MTHNASPAFGEADLSNCEREQIHLAGSVQPHGALLVLDDAGETVLQASSNAADWLGSSGRLVGRALSTLPGDLGSRLRHCFDEASHRKPVVVRGCRGDGSQVWDALVHRPPEGGIVVELERSSGAAHRRADLEAIGTSIIQADSLRALAERVTAVITDATGYDRVMVYRFDELGHGEVFAERRRDELEAFLGNRYPASDIPQMARRLYVQNRVRLLVDVDYEPVPLVPRLFPPTGRDLDMSLCQLRSMSPIHLQYLRNMGVQATLVVSLVVGGELWGLIACHHYEPRFVSFEARALCEWVAELVATRIVALESLARTEAEHAVRRLERRMVEAVQREGGWQAALFDGSRALLDVMRASGAVLLADGVVHALGEVPGTAAVREFATWLDAGPREPVVSLSAISREAPSLGALASAAAGCVAVPISDGPGEYLLWFRPERKTTVTWGGDPNKPVIVGTDPRQLSPRLSFAQWHEVVEGTAEPWTVADKMTARLLGRAVAALRLQVRSRQILAAQDQLETLSRQVRSAAGAMLLANAAGRITLTTQPFSDLLKAGQSPPQRLDDLTRLFEESLSLVGRLDDLLRRDLPFRQDVSLMRFGQAAQPFSLRAAPVLDASGRRLGYVVELGELAERRSAEAARSRFEDALARHSLAPTGRHDLEGSREYEGACMKSVENARLAALEVTYGEEVEGMARLLESVRASVARSAELTELLVDGGNAPLR